MHKVIEDIIKSNRSGNKKLAELDKLKDEIKLAEDIIRGVYKYCPECDDYYLSKSFVSEIEYQDCKICTYSDPINSSGNEYVDGIAQITYSICPKGHRKELYRYEEKKNN